MIYSNAQRSFTEWPNFEVWNNLINSKFKDSDLSIEDRPVRYLGSGSSPVLISRLFDQCYRRTTRIPQWSENSFVSCTASCQVLGISDRLITVVTPGQPPSADIRRISYRLCSSRPWSFQLEKNWSRQARQLNFCIYLMYSEEITRALGSASHAEQAWASENMSPQNHDAHGEIMPRVTKG